MSIPKILPSVIRAFPVYSEMADSITEAGVTPMDDKSIVSKQYAVPINMPPTIPALIIPDVKICACHNIHQHGGKKNWEQVYNFLHYQMFPFCV